MKDRGKSLGANIGISVGLGFAFGIPLGAALVSTQGPDLPLYLAAFISLFVIAYVIFIPVCDTYSTSLKSSTAISVVGQLDNDQQISLKSSSMSSSATSPLHNDEVTTNSFSIVTTVTTAPDRNIAAKVSRFTGRRMPSDWRKFFRENHAFSGFSLIKEAKFPLDWLSYFFSYIAQQVLIAIFINYSIEVFGWSTAVAGVVIALVGVTVAAVAPVVSKKYPDLPLFFWGVTIQMCAYSILAIAGTGIDKTIAMIIGCPAILLLAVGGFYISTMQSILTSQYANDRQGEVSGVISQVGQLSIIPGYPIALLFSYTQSSSALIYWPGVSYGLVSRLNYLVAFNSTILYL